MVRCTKEPVDYFAASPTWPVVILKSCVVNDVDDRCYNVTGIPCDSIKHGLQPPCRT